MQESFFFTLHHSWEYHVNPVTHLQYFVFRHALVQFSCSLNIIYIHTIQVFPVILGLLAEKKGNKWSMISTLKHNKLNVPQHVHLA